MLRDAPARFVVSWRHAREIGGRRRPQREVARDRPAAGLEGTVGDLLDVPLDSSVRAVYFSVQVQSEAVMLGGPELGRGSPVDRYEPRWVDADLLAQLPLVPDAAMRAATLVFGER